MSYLSDEQLQEIANKPFPRFEDALKHLRDLYEVHLKEKDEILRESLAYIMETGHEIDCPANRTANQSGCACGRDALLSRIIF